MKPRVSQVDVISLSSTCWGN